MKKLKNLFIITAFVASLLLACTLSAKADSVRVNADILNVRASESTSSKIIAKVSNGTELTCLSGGNGWYKVRLSNGSEGFVKAEYVTYTSYGYVNATVLKVHSEPGLSTPVTGRLINGTMVELLSLDNSWYKIKAPDGSEGYVSADYISSSSAVSYITYGYVTADVLRVHSSTGVFSPVTGRLTQNTKVELLAYDGSWYKIKSPDGSVGYVSADYISMTPGGSSVKYGYVDATLLNVRESPGTDTAILDRIVMGSAVEILSNEDSWYKIKAPNGLVGFVSAEYISQTPIETADISSAGENITASSAHDAPTDSQLSLGQAIVATARKYIGTPYVYAAAGPSSFDCSGFTMYVMNLHGISLPHQSASQAQCGYEVAMDELVAGDLVFFNTTRKSGVGHVGIYIGDGQFIHASSGSAHAVTISSLSEDYYSAHYLGARRVI